MVVLINAAIAWSLQGLVFKQKTVSVSLTTNSRLLSYDFQFRHTQSFHGWLLVSNFD